MQIALGSSLLVDVEGDLAGILSLATKKGEAWPKPQYDLAVCGKSSRV
jgi:hypothetical protein